MQTEPSYSDHILPLIRRVRKMLLPHYGKVAFTEKQGGPRDMVTELDNAIETYYRAEFAKCYPDIAFVGEETGGDKGAKRFWLVDPIDGTEHFIRGLPFCTSQVALIENNEVVFSAIYDFVNDVLYSTQKGLGAYANGETLRVSSRSLRQARLGYFMDFENKKRLPSFLSLGKHCYLFHTGASGIEFAMIASGKLEGAVYFCPISKDHDVAPGTLLVAEAGGVVANIGSHTFDYRNPNLIAANPRIFKELTGVPDAIFPIKE